MGGRLVMVERSCESGFEWIVGVIVCVGWFGCCCNVGGGLDGICGAIDWPCGVHPLIC